ncbi:hypothetical protein, partial [Aeromonas media]
MNIEHVDNVFFKSNLQQLLAQIYIDNKNEASKNDDINILNLLAFPVTSKSLFRDDVWDYTQGEIVNILLKIKNSFLPTKQ